MKAKRLMSEVAAVMADVLVHQRARWGALLADQRQFEGWWKAEMVQALESWSWCFRDDWHESPYAVGAEAKPASFGVEGQPPTADLVVAPWKSEVQDFDYGARPRVWTELKQRATWWGMTPGATAKAFGSANKGLMSDLEKWKGVTGEGEVVLVCQISLHDGTESETLPASWQEELDSLAKQYEHATMPRIVGYEIAPSRRDVRTGETASEQRVRWARFDAFVVNRGW